MKFSFHAKKNSELLMLIMFIDNVPKTSHNIYLNNINYFDNIIFLITFIAQVHQGITWHNRYFNNMLMMWIYRSGRCIKTYQVLYSKTSEAGPYKMVNDVDIIFTAYHVIVEEDQGNSPLKYDFLYLISDVWRDGNCKGDISVW